MTCPNCGQEFDGGRCPNCGRPRLKNGFKVAAILLLVLVALLSALMGGCAIVVGVASLFGPGGFWSGAPAILFGTILIGAVVSIVWGVKAKWRG